jgi:hypothetical protein
MKSIEAFLQKALRRQGIDSITYGVVPKGSAPLVSGIFGTDRRVLAGDFIFLREPLGSDALGTTMAFDETKEAVVQNGEPLAPKSANQSDANANG